MVGVGGKPGLAGEARLKRNRMLSGGECRAFREGVCRLVTLGPVTGAMDGRGDVAAVGYDRAVSL